MSVPLGCWNCQEVIPEPPPQGIYCPRCGNYNGPLALAEPSALLLDLTLPPVLVPDGSMIDLADTSKPPEVETDVPSFDAIEHGCEVRGRGVHVPRMNARLSVKGFLLRIDDDLNPEMWMEVAISDELILAFLPSILAQMPEEGVQEVREMLFHPE